MTSAFAIFRGKDAVPYDEAGCMTPAPMSEAVIAGSMALAEAGYDNGHRVTLLFAAPGFSLTHVWFKSSFPLPRHSHDADCLYYVVAGSLRLGTEVIGPGDGFFVGRDVPYTYVPGDAGVEVLEFRTAEAFDIKLLADNPAWWAKALATVAEKQADWAKEGVPDRSL